MKIKKGKEYEIFGVGRHSETLKEFVIYRALYDSPKFGANSICIRPIKMFFDEKELPDGNKVKRFEYIGN